MCGSDSERGVASRENSVKVAERFRSTQDSRELWKKDFSVSSSSTWRRTRRTGSIFLLVILHQPRKALEGKEEMDIQYPISRLTDLQFFV